MGGLSNAELMERARQIRRTIIEMVHAAGCGHPGGSLGLTDILTVLYFDILNHRPEQPDWPERDRLLISNGHVSPVRYAAMKAAGYFRKLDIMSFRRLGSPFQGHPSTRYLPEVENSSGSLGQGLSQAVALALGLKMQGRTGRVFCGISDGECGEGMTWEAATAAVHYRSPVIAFMDYNGIQIDGRTRDVCDLGDLEKKFSAFGWKTITIDGHDFDALRTAFRDARQYDAGPQMILCKTVIGKGVSYMEDDPGWHGKAPNDELAAQALRELSS
ncbi:MAG: transketolase [Leptospiraceae bacterium]|nr:transketolase [Leptospiraceae bacterium]